MAGDDIMLERLIGMKIEHGADYVFIKFPFWTSKQMRYDSLSNIARDIEVKKGGKVHREIGAQWAKISWNNPECTLLGDPECKHNAPILSEQEIATGKLAEWRYK
jgi:hypothetical protein